MNAAILPLKTPRIAPEPLGGWYVIVGSFGWLFGSRSEALIAIRELQGQRQ